MNLARLARLRHVLLLDKCPLVRASFRYISVYSTFSAELPMSLLFVGIKDSVIALDAATGETVWATPLGGSDYVAVLWDGTSLYATNRGEVWCLDPMTGAVKWHNQLKGYGRGMISLASTVMPTNSTSETDFRLMKRKRDQDAAAAAAAAG